MINKDHETPLDQRLRPSFKALVASLDREFTRNELYELRDTLIAGIDDESTEAIQIMIDAIQDVTDRP